MHKLKPQYIKLTAKNRLYHVKKPIIGLTGGIATGKSAASHYFKEFGVPLIDADRLVKDIYSSNMAKSFIQETIPRAIIQGEINFRVLREVFFSNEEIKQKVEAFVYARLENQFIREYEKLDFSQYDFFIYDVPLLFEKNLDLYVDVTLTIYAPKEVQRERVIKRDKHGPELAEKIISSQMCIELKKSKSLLVINNINNLNQLKTTVRNALDDITET